MKNIVELLIGNLKEKAEYKAAVKLLKNLPEDYQYVYKAIESYIYIMLLLAGKLLSY